MKKLVILAAILILATGACKQTTEREVSPTETSATTTVSVDTASATDAANDAAYKTGTAMESAGQAIQDQTKTDGGTATTATTSTSTTSSTTTKTDTK
jgi:uncharacterized lipoprotein YajG